MTRETTHPPRELPNWWKDAVIYQIYPRSFADSTGDGIGDIKGITKKLSYIDQLGVDGIWISPFFKSPMKDFGYDVSDYRAVDPLFGSLADFEELVREAHRRNIRVVIDQVYSHTSDLHPWFIESKTNLTNSKADWYVWADANPDGSPPNNWQSVFGGSAWTWNSARCQYYLHNFLVEQPDLNFHNPEVVTAILEVAKFWLELGVDGFRLDTVNFYFHDLQLRSNPPLPEGRTALTGPMVNPYMFQKHLYDKTQPENIEFLKKFRTLLDQYGDVMTIGEVGEEQRGLEVTNEYTKDGDRLHTCYGFDFLSSNFSPTFFKERIELFEKMRSSSTKASATETNAATRSYACWAFSNHDVTRSYTRWLKEMEPTYSPTEHNHDFAKFIIALLGTLEGPICIYEGEELGLPEVELTLEELKDPYGIYFYPAFKGRDGCRTPMPWNNEKKQLGFSEADPTWLPLGKEHSALAVNIQEKDKDSTLHFTRQFLKFRKAQEVMRLGKIRVEKATETFLVLSRTLESENESETMFACFNFTAEKVNIPPLARGRGKGKNSEELMCFEHNCIGVNSDKDSWVSLGGFGHCFLISQHNDKK